MTENLSPDTLATFKDICQLIDQTRQNITVELNQTMRESGFLPADVTDVELGDPYLLTFLGLVDGYSDPDFESALLSELQKTLMAFGGDFAFMGRKKPITIDERDYYIDLLFFHRGLNCLVVVALKMGEFETAHTEEMALYLQHLEKHEQLESENAPIGLILCTSKNHEHVELLQLDKSNIRVADYLTLLPPKEVLEEKLHRSIEHARQRMMLNGSNDDA
ncbi:PDDEXK nuclease domain-containing protein [Thiothrix lacustris]|uniref:PDDEXK nuclease domain-containing protein n=1 Tax=Thiothrix lacustris TaxID=525917 RepID=UPI00068553CB|nr:PDDEXK nuclease domain-containing protein [Thiothrix lacustris]